MVKKYKKQDSSTYALGATLVMELLDKKPSAARTVYLSPKCTVREVAEKAEGLGVPIVTGERAFNILSPKGNCFAIAEFDKFASPISVNRRHIVLVNPSDSGNLGTIMRAVAAFDCADLAVIRPAADPFDPKTVRASMGAVFDISFSEFDSFDEYISRFPSHKIMPFMLNGSPLCKIEFDSAEMYSLVFGNEATGLDPSFARFGGVKIEQSEKVDSLNLSVATAIALYKLYSSLL